MVGKITNIEKLRLELLASGSVLQGENQAEVLMHLMARSSQRTAVNRLVDALWQTDGAFCLVMATADALVAVRDPYGFRPLILGSLDGSTIIVSEDQAIHRVGGHVIREIDPGEMVIVNQRGAVSVRPFPRREHAPCALEPIRLTSMGARWQGWSTHQVQRELGDALARQPGHAGEIDLVVPADTHVRAAAVGFARAIDATIEDALILADESRETRVLPGLVQGQRVALLAASTLTGRDLRSAVYALRQGGATEVHVHVVTPRITRSCPYGVMMSHSADTELLGNKRHEIPTSLVGANSLSWLSLDSMHDVLSVHAQSEGRCTACLGGDLPSPVTHSREQLGLFDVSESDAG
jgi:amidophosphoribosyltransferase